MQNSPDRKMLISLPGPFRVCVLMNTLTHEIPCSGRACQSGTRRPFLRARCRKPDPGSSVTGRRVFGWRGLNYQIGIDSGFITHYSPIVEAPTLSYQASVTKSQSGVTRPFGMRLDYELTVPKLR